jgi:hypothetical protein
MYLRVHHVPGKFAHFVSVSSTEEQLLTCTGEHPTCATQDTAMFVTVHWFMNLLAERKTTTAQRNLAQREANQFKGYNMKSTPYFLIRKLSGPKLVVSTMTSASSRTNTCRIGQRKRARATRATTSSDQNLNQWGQFTEIRSNNWCCVCAWFRSSSYFILSSYLNVLGINRPSLEQIFHFARSPHNDLRSHLECGYVYWVGA